MWVFFFCGVTSGDFKVCTILFSDVVTFTNICAACEPIQIVNMLNAMYSRFDRLTNVHNVYKVRRKLNDVCCHSSPPFCGVFFSVV